MTVSLVKTTNTGSIFMDATKLSDVQEWVNETVTNPDSINLEKDDDVITSKLKLKLSFKYKTNNMIVSIINYYSIFR